jgi:hypothetical protein
MQAVTPALPLSHYLFHEFSGDCPPVSDVRCHYWCVGVFYTQMMKSSDDTACAGLGITYIYINVTESLSSTFFVYTLCIDIWTSYRSACLALNLTLMTMIIIRVALHHRTMQRAMGPSAPAGGLYRTIATMLVESFALYTLSLLVYIATFASGSVAEYPFGGIVGGAQVCTFFVFATVMQSWHTFV